MQALGNYLLRIVAAALLLGAAGQLVRGKRGKQMLRLCGGLCMALVVLAPLPGLASLAGSNSLSDALLASEPAAENLAQVREELGKLISQQTEAYILDKARSLGASVTVKVSLEPLRRDDLRCGDTGTAAGAGPVAAGGSGADRGAGHMGGIKEKSAGALARLGKYKYALLVLLLGVVLLLLPSGGKAAKAETPAAQDAGQQEMAEDAAALQAQLGKLLSQIQGAGEVEVILTLRTGTQYVYQTDVTQEERSGEDDPQSSVTRETVLAASGSGQQQAVVTQTIYPTYRGAVVISQGADQPQVKLDLVCAVSSLTGLSADKITVVKMKEQ